MHRLEGASVHLLLDHIIKKWIPGKMTCSIPASDCMREPQHTTNYDRVCVKLVLWNLPTNTG